MAIPTTLKQKTTSPCRVDCDTAAMLETRRHCYRYRPGYAPLVAALPRSWFTGDTWASLDGTRLVNYKRKVMLLISLWSAVGQMSNTVTPLELVFEKKVVRGKFIGYLVWLFVVESANDEAPGDSEGEESEAEEAEEGGRGRKKQENIRFSWPAAMDALAKCVKRRKFRSRQTDGFEANFRSVCPIAGNFFTPSSFVEMVCDIKGSCPPGIGEALWGRVLHTPFFDLGQFYSIGDALACLYDQSGQCDHNDPAWRLSEYKCGGGHVSLPTDVAVIAISELDVSTWAPTAVELNFHADSAAAAEPDLHPEALIADDAASFPPEIRNNFRRFRGSVEQALDGDDFSDIAQVDVMSLSKEKSLMFERCYLRAPVKEFHRLHTVAVRNDMWRHRVCRERTNRWAPFIRGLSSFSSMLLGLMGGLMRVCNVHTPEHYVTMLMLVCPWGKVNLHYFGPAGCGKSHMGVVLDKLRIPISRIASGSHLTRNLVGGGRYAFLIMDEASPFASSDSTAALSDGQGVRLRTRDFEIEVVNTTWTNIGCFTNLTPGVMRHQPGVFHLPNLDRFIHIEVGFNFSTRAREFPPPASAKETAEFTSVVSELSATASALQDFMRSGKLAPDLTIFNLMMAGRIDQQRHLQSVMNMAVAFAANDLAYVLNALDPGSPIHGYRPTSARRTRVVVLPEHVATAYGIYTKSQAESHRRFPFHMLYQYIMAEGRKWMNDDAFVAGPGGVVVAGSRNDLDDDEDPDEAAAAADLRMMFGGRDDDDEDPDEPPRGRRPQRWGQKRKRDDKGSGISEENKLNHIGELVEFYKGLEGMPPLPANSVPVPLRPRVPLELQLAQLAADMNGRIKMDGTSAEVWAKGLALRVRDSPNVSVNGNVLFVNTRILRRSDNLASAFTTFNSYLVPGQSYALLQTGSPAVSLDPEVQDHNEFRFHVAAPGEDLEAVRAKCRDALRDKIPERHRQRFLELREPHEMIRMYADFAQHKDHGCQIYRCTVDVGLGIQARLIDLLCTPNNYFEGVTGVHTHSVATFQNFALTRRGYEEYAVDDDDDDDERPAKRARLDANEDLEGDNPFEEEFMFDKWPKGTEPQAGRKRRRDAGYERHPKRRAGPGGQVLRLEDLVAESRKEQEGLARGETPKASPGDDEYLTEDEDLTADEGEDPSTLAETGRAILAQYTS